LAEMIKVFSGYERPVPFDTGMAMREISWAQRVTQAMVVRAYFSVVSQVQQHFGIPDTLLVPLSGSCGGRFTSGREMKGILSGLDRRGPVSQLLDMHDAPFRSTFQRGEKWEYHEGRCRACRRDVPVGPCGICKECEKKM